MKNFIFKNITNFVKNRLAITVLVALLTFSISPLALISMTALNTAHADAHIENGNFALVSNNTKQVAWTDPVSADPADVVEYLITVRNDGDQPEEDVQVRSQLDENPGTQLMMIATIYPTHNGAGPIQDEAIVNVSALSGGLRAYNGHTRFLGVTDRFNCPSTCDISDEVINGAMTVGTIQPGQFVQVSFKATVSETAQVSPSPSPSPSLSPSPSPSPSLSPSPSPSASPSVTPSPSASPSGTPSPSPSVTPSPTPSGGGSIIVNSCTGQGSCSGTANAQANAQGGTVLAAAQPKVVSTAATQVTTLPKTGLPLAGWALASLLPVGARLKKFAGMGSDKEEQTANFIWEEREFKK